MPGSHSCPKCQRPVESSAPHELCPACLLEAMLPNVDVTQLAQQPATPEVDPAPVVERPGARIGRYKLLHEIGEGGFGTVYIAEQEEPVRRRVALKVIKVGMYTKEIIARFEQERQALALMDHPNIARILDGGATANGRPYFVMELVKGERITEYCDEHKLSARQRLELFAQVCQAIQHAHQKGIIHRDIKPSNILVTVQDGVAVPKVIDFGIAKATGQQLTDKTVFTQLDQFMGTPAYMSPEQVAMGAVDIDTRTDIYSLGVLLYQLLTGRTPFDTKELLQAGFDEMRRKIREEEPPRPSTRISTLKAEDQTTVAKHRQTDTRKLASLLRGDLDWIVMKALEKDRTRRYETANGFAQDIKLFLADEPVSAAAPSAMYRFGKFARRNRTTLSVAAAIAAILVAATITSTWQAIRATRAEGQVKRQVIEVAAERDAKGKALQAAVVAREEAEAMYEFIGDVLESPDPARDGRTITVAELLDNAVKKLDADRSPSTRDIRGHLLFALAKTYYALGLNRQAIPIFEKAYVHSVTTRGLEDSHTLGSMKMLARCYLYAGRIEEAIKLQEEELRRTRKTNGPKNYTTAGVMNELALSYGRVGRVDEALKLQEEAIAIQRETTSPEDPDRLVGLNNLALAYSHAGRKVEAGKLLEEIVPLARKRYGSESPRALIPMKNLASFYLDAGRKEEALKMFEELLTLNLKMNGPEHLHTISVMYGLASSYVHVGRKEDALKLSEETLALSRKALGPGHFQTLAVMDSLASLYTSMSRTNEALQLRDERTKAKELASQPASLQPENGESADPASLSTGISIDEKYTRANFYYRQGRYAEAEPLYREVLQADLNQFPGTNEVAVGTAASLARNLADWAWAERNSNNKARAYHHADEAQRRLRDCLAARQRGTNAASLRTADVKSRLGFALLAVAVTDGNITPAARAARFAEAEPLLLESAPALQMEAKVSSAYKRDSLERLVRLYEAWPKPDKLAEWKQKLETFDKAR